MLLLISTVLLLINHFVLQGILDPFSKVLGHALQAQPLEYHYLVDLCYLCNRAFTRVSQRTTYIICLLICNKCIIDIDLTGTRQVNTVQNDDIRIDSGIEI